MPIPVYNTSVKFAKPGHRYKSEKGITFQFAFGYPKGLLLSQDGRSAMAYLVGPNGQPGSKLYPLPLIYSKLTALRVPGRGRTTHHGSPWSGFGFKYPHIMEDLLDRGVSCGYYRIDHENYISLGYEGRTVFVVTRGGSLGMRPGMAKVFEHEGFTIKFGGFKNNFFQHRLSMESVLASNKYKAFKDLYVSALKAEMKHGVEECY